MRAASGRQSNASMQASYTLSEYFILPESTKAGPASLFHDQLAIHARLKRDSIRSIVSAGFFYPAVSSSANWMLFVSASRGGWGKKGARKSCFSKLTGCRLTCRREWNEGSLRRFVRFDVGRQDERLKIKLIFTLCNFCNHYYTVCFSNLKRFDF